MPVEPENLEHLFRQTAESIRKADRDAQNMVSLVPSEALMSPMARAPLTSDFYFRYFFNESADPDFWEFRGGQSIGHIEREVTLPSLMRLSRASHVNVRPLSGLNTMLCVVSALCGPVGSHVVCVLPACGGHFATANLIRRLGREPAFMSVRRGRVDEAQLERLLLDTGAELVYVDLQNSLEELDIRAISDTIERSGVDSWLHIDCSHTLGLVLGGAHANPLEQGAASFGGSTHKSFPGPQKGVFFTDRSAGAERFRTAQYDLISSHHFAETLALGLASLEFEYFGEQYAIGLMENAQVLEHSLADAGLNVEPSDPTRRRTHQVWLSLESQQMTTIVSERLSEAGLLVNVQRSVPGLQGPVFRLGVNEVTFRGAGPSAMRLIADAFVDALSGPVRVSAQQIAEAFRRPYYFSSNHS